MRLSNTGSTIACVGCPFQFLAGVLLILWERHTLRLATSVARNCGRAACADQHDRPGAAGPEQATRAATQQDLRATRGLRWITLRLPYNEYASVQHRACHSAGEG